MNHYILYSTLGCHLCEQAQMIIDAQGLEYDVVDIAEDNQLMESYGVRIPVLRDNATGQELGWPFDGEGLKSWLDS